MVYWVAALVTLVYLWMTPVRAGVLYVSGRPVRLGLLIGPVRIQPDPARLLKKKKAPKKAPLFARQDLLRAASLLLKGVQVEKIALEASLHTPDACHTALLCGLAGGLCNSVRACFPSLSLHARVSPDFHGPKSQVRAGGIMSITIGHIIRTAFFLLTHTISYMDKHPIEGIMTTTMENIREMVDVNTVIGDAVTSPDGSTIIPISKVSFGFVAGGGEYSLNRTVSQTAPEVPFAGGTGAGVSVQPMGFLVIKENQVRLTPAQYYAPLDHLMEMIPQLIGEVKSLLHTQQGQ